MKHLKTTYLSILSVLLLFTSCTIEKRVHLPGYYIEWHKSGNSLTKNKKIKADNNGVDNQLAMNKIKTLSIQNDNDVDDNDVNFFASSSNNILLTKTLTAIPTNQKKIKQQSQIKTDLDEDCDIIILKNGQEIQVKILEVGHTEIKYKACDNQNGPTFSKNNSEIFMIKYSNGTKTVMDDSKSNSDKTTVNKETNDNPGDRSFMIAVILWFFLGALGFHRFYLGHIGIGILYLLTGSLCGIGWLIDGILFLTGKLQPKNGKYTDEIL